MSTFDRNPLGSFDDDALRAELRGAFAPPVHSPESVLEGLRPRLRASRRRYIATRAGAAATAIVASVVVIAGLHGGSSANGLHIDTRPAGEPTVSTPSRPAPGRGSGGSTTTATSPTRRGDGRSVPGPGTVPTTSLVPGAIPPPGSPVLLWPPTVTVPNRGAPSPGAGSGGTPTPSTTPVPSTTTPSSQPLPTTTTVPASGTQVFTVRDSSGFVFGTVQVQWQGSTLTFDAANPCTACTFVESQGDPNELDVTFTRTTDSAQAHLHLEMQSQPAWHPVVD